MNRSGRALPLCFRFGRIVLAHRSGRRSAPVSGRGDLHAPAAASVCRAAQGAVQRLLPSPRRLKCGFGLHRNGAASAAPMRTCILRGLSGRAAAVCGVYSASGTRQRSLCGQKSPGGQGSTSACGKDRQTREALRQAEKPRQIEKRFGVRKRPADRDTIPVSVPFLSRLFHDSGRQKKPSDGYDQLFSIAEALTARLKAVFFFFRFFTGGSCAWHYAA